MANGNNNMYIHPFKIFIMERKTDIMYSKYNQMAMGYRPAGTIPGLLNPTYNELVGALKRARYQELRIILHDTTLYAWDSALPPIHEDVMAGEEIERGPIFTGYVVMTKPNDTKSIGVVIHQLGWEPYAKKSRTLSKLFDEDPEHKHWRI